MNNVMTINGFSAVILFDPDLQMFRGEFTGLNGGADFYANDVAGLLAEGRKSLDTFLEVCAERGIEPRKEYSGKVLLRISRQVHEAATIAAQSEGKSFNQWAADVLEHAAQA
ncbi:MAG: type II toxin-antitoxin system HicB family antitoxin [Janthinobacterium lividum]